MKQPSVYLKMRVLGAVDTVEGRTRHERIHNVAAMTFLDEEGNPRRFTWRTIQTWHYRYKNHGITGMTPQPRKDKGQVRKATPEELLEAINAARPHFRSPRTNKRAIYRLCIEKGLLQRDRIAQTTFYRFIREYGLLAPDSDDNKNRLAFSMKYANQPSPPDRRPDRPRRRCADAIRRHRLRGDARWAVRGVRGASEIAAAGARRCRPSASGGSPSGRSTRSVGETPLEVQFGGVTNRGAVLEVGIALSERLLRTGATRGPK